jgi:Raf kinase inhibitor-like YbhB/YbcL family protein
MKGFAPVLALAALAGCGAKEEVSNRANGDTAVENATLTKLAVTSAAFEDGQPIPAQYTCDGAGQSPALAWGEPPPGTKSFALIVDDPDAPSGLFRHWGAYDIPASARSIAEGQAVGNQAVNGFGKSGYGGPCPPTGHDPHHYHFKLYALDVAELGLPGNPKVEEIESEAQKHAIAQGELIGTYERK